MQSSSLLNREPLEDFSSSSTTSPAQPLSLSPENHTPVPRDPLYIRLSSLISQPVYNISTICRQFNHLNHPAIMCSTTYTCDYCRTNHLIRYQTCADDKCLRGSKYPNISFRYVNCNNNLYTSMDLVSTTRVAVRECV